MTFIQEPPKRTAEMPEPPMPPFSGTIPRTYPESNATYNLEIRQTRRNFLFFAVLLIGMTAGLYLFCAVLNPDEDYLRDLPSVLIPIGLYFFGMMLIVVYSTLKLALQQVNEDQTLRTPMRSRTVLWGKLQVALTLTLCLVLPSLPGVIGLLALPDPRWLFLVVIVSILTPCLCMIGLGFASGARSPFLCGLLLFLNGLFLATNFPSFSLLFFSFYDMFYYNMEDYGNYFACFSGAMVMILISAGTVYWIGNALFVRNRNLIHVMYGAVIVVTILTPFPLLFILAAKPELFFLLAVTLLWFAYFGLPILAMNLVLKHDDAQRNLPTNQMEHPSLRRRLLAALGKRRHRTVDRTHGIS